MVPLSRPLPSPLMSTGVWFPVKSSRKDCAARVARNGGSPLNRRQHVRLTFERNRVHHVPERVIPVDAQVRTIREQIVPLYTDRRRRVLQGALFEAAETNADSADSLHLLGRSRDSGECAEAGRPLGGVGERAGA